MNAQDEMLAATARQATFFFFKEGFIDYLSDYIEGTGEPENSFIFTWVEMLHVVTQYCADWSRENESEADQLDELFEYVENAVNTCVIVNGLEADPNNTDAWASASAIASKEILLALCYWSTDRSTPWRYSELVKVLHELELADLKL